MIIKIMGAKEDLIYEKESFIFAAGIGNGI